MSSASSQARSCRSARRCRWSTRTSRSRSTRPSRPTSCRTTPRRSRRPRRRPRSTRARDHEQLQAAHPRRAERAGRRGAAGARGHVADQRQPRGPGQRGRRRERPVGQLGRVRQRDPERRHHAGQLAAAGMAAGAPTQVEQRPRPIPRRATGVELIGRFEDSGFKEPPYLARRADGQVVQLAPVLYALAEEVDGKRDTEQIAEALSHRIQRGVDASMVEMLLDEQLGRLGVVAQRDGVTAEVAKVDPLLALKFRTRVVPAGVVRAATTVFRPLFWPPLQFALSIAFAGCVVWLFGLHGISQGLRHLLYQPALLFLLVGGVIVATAFHELGHATAVRYGGARPGVMGVGVYIVWPAFYTDVTDAYRLGKWGRLRADTGGMYFNALFALAMGGVYVATGFEPILLLVVLQNFAIVQQSLPLLRLDGYYIISDLTGVPDMLSRVKPVLASLLPGHPADRRVTELKPWVRRTVTGYVLTVIPVLLLAFLMMLVHAPRAFATGYDSVVLHSRAAGSAFGHDRTLAGVMDVVEALVLVL